MKLESFYVVILNTKDGQSEPVKYTIGKPTNRQIKLAYNRFKGDGDVLYAGCTRASRFFNSVRELKDYFGEYKGDTHRYSWRTTRKPLKT